VLGFLTCPSALVGGLLAAYFNGAVISLGVAGRLPHRVRDRRRNMIMLISHYQHLERHEGMVFGPELVLRGAMERLSPILMTALATGWPWSRWWSRATSPGTRSSTRWRWSFSGARRVDGVQPVRGAVALPALRGTPPRTERSEGQRCMEESTSRQPRDVGTAGGDGAHRPARN
jgi:hypothetical protein